MSTSVATADHYVIIEGGVVQNDPVLPVFDLDVLETRFVDIATYDEVDDLHRRADELGVHQVAARCRDWLADHPHLDPAAADVEVD